MTQPFNGLDLFDADSKSKYIFHPVNTNNKPICDQIDILSEQSQIPLKTTSGNAYKSYFKLKNIYKTFKFNDNEKIKKSNVCKRRCLNLKDVLTNRKNPNFYYAYVAIILSVLLIAAFFSSIIIPLILLKNAFPFSALFKLIFNLVREEVKNLL